MKGVYQVLRGKPVGMTLFEVLISFSIFMLIVSILPVVFSLLNQKQEDMISYEEHILFLAQLQLDFRNGDSFWTNHNNTILYFNRPTDNSTIQFEMYQDKVRRRVNRTGHEVYLQNVKSMNVQSFDYGIVITLTSKNGATLHSTIVHPSFLPWGYSDG
ncbi:ComG operon protein [Evansella cellulosilytica DSM 2522]|uniref:ComG operon protein n=2 Tax=Evansella TaxID=2837485 RepID=E6TWZ3_EVAC2|nr:ComG operon protein [Evansella cellulosilytica DSM 2522]